MLATRKTHGKGYFTRKMGPLQRQLRLGEYGLFKSSPMFESDFVQISKQGGPIEIHNQEQIVTVGITSTSPVLLIPNVLLLARRVLPPEDQKVTNRSRSYPPVRYELTRLFPLRFVKITIHNAERQQLRFKLANGRTFYLQLCPDSDRREDLFDAWVRIVQLLRPPSESSLSVKEKPKPSRVYETPAIQPPPIKRASPQRAATSKSKSKSKVNVSTRTASKTAKIQKKDTKKSKAPVVLSESTASVHVMIPPPSVEDAHAPDPRTPPTAQEIAEKLKEVKNTVKESEEKIKPSPSHKGLPAEKSSSHTRRKSSDKKSRASRSRSGNRGASQKPSKILSLIRSCSWSYSKKDKRRGSKSRSKGKKS
ncbi:protein FAM71B-like [Sceloporus undulatus]|uniref:protein FAM71B-like n=1 Tax=Sceloporus undulatus TaxID=8520 RepID=UPI001C4D902B|nr:protein FAM71B-like [Sceloporus undulatus]XP_042332835.1 protein FAM71B-like [Sceloporus undulatus]